MARLPESSLDASIPLKRRVRTRDARRSHDVERKASTTEVPDVQVLIQRAMQGTFGNQIVQAALKGESVEGLGEVIAAEMAASAAGMGAVSEEGAGLLALGNAALSKAAKKVGGGTSFAEVIAELRAGGRGEALPTAVRQEMEQLFGRDLGGVRIHTDTSDQVQALRAEAVALGSHLHFAEGRFDPNTRAGRALLAHEITHVVQHEEGRLPGVSGVSNRAMGAEKEAYANEHLIDLPFVRAEAPVEFASDVTTGIEPSAHADSFAGAMASSGTFGWSGASLGVGEVSAMGTDAGSLVGTVESSLGAGPVEASSGAPAMLRESDDIDQEESNTEAAARYEVIEGLEEGFRCASQKVGDEAPRDIFTGPAPCGHVAQDEYNAVMRDIGPDGEDRSSGGDGYLVEPVVDRLMEAPMDFLEYAIGGAPEDAPRLLAYIEEAGEGAYSLLDAVIARSPGIAIALLSLSPSVRITIYLLQLLQRLDAERIADHLTDPEKWMVVVEAAIRHKKIDFALSILELVSPSFRFLRLVPESLLEELWDYAWSELDEAADKIREAARAHLVETWPVGLGLAVGADVGATMGIPVHLGLDAYSHVSHASPGNFRVTRGGVVKVGLDSGVGAGGFIGGKQYGIGAAVGAKAGGDLMLMVHQEFEFPVLEDEAFRPFVLTALGIDLAPVMLSPLMLFIVDLESTPYNTKTKFTPKVSTEANAGAEAGIRTRGSNTSNGWTTKPSSQDVGEERWWLNWFKAELFARLMSERAFGFEIQNRDFTRTEDGERVPTTMQVEVFAERAAALQLAHALPMISRLLPPGIDWQAGAGLKVMWVLRGSPTDVIPRVSDPTYSLYLTNGEWDRYMGEASEASFAIHLNREAFSSFEAFLSNIGAKAEFKRRILLGSLISSKILEIAQSKGALRAYVSKSPDDGTERAIRPRLEGYLDLVAELTAEQLRSIFRAIVAVYSEYREAGAPLQQLHQDVMAFLATGDGPPHVMAQLERVANVVLASLTRLHLRGVVELDAAVDGHASAIAKVRLKGMAGVKATIDQDLLQYVDGRLTVNDIRNLLTDTASGVGFIDIEDDPS